MSLLKVWSPMMTHLNSYLLALLLFPIGLCGVEIAITFDDHPMPGTERFSSLQRTERFVDVLDKHGCQAAFFCIGQACEQDPTHSSLRLLNHYGHFLANHSFTHRHLSQQPLENFVSELDATDAILGDFSGMRRWYRFPYLDYGCREPLGGSTDKMTAALTLMEERGYVEGYVTMNTFDWHLDMLLERAIEHGELATLETLKAIYLELLDEWCRYYIGVYDERIDRPITHTLLLHANDLNALFLDDVLTMIQNNGWTLVSPEQAFEDVSWREEVLADPSLLTLTPPSMDCRAIERRFQDAGLRIESRHEVIDEASY